MFGDRLTAGQSRRHRDLAPRRARDHHQARSGVLTHFSFNIGDVLILINMVLWGVYSASLRWRPAIHPTSFMFMFCADLRRRDAAGVGVGIFDRLSAAADRADVLGRSPS